MIKGYFRGFMMITTRMLEKPLWLMLVFSLCVMSLVYLNHSVWDLPVGVIDQDHSSASRMVIRGLDSSSKIAVKNYLEELGYKTQDETNYQLTMYKPGYFLTLTFSINNVNKGFLEVTY